MTKIENILWKQWAEKVELVKQQLEHQTMSDMELELLRDEVELIADDLEEIE